MSELNNPSQAIPATGVRFRVVAICCLSAVLLYLDRFCMNFAQRYVQEDLAIDHDQFGYVMSSFFITYALFQIPSGWLTDRYGPRRMLTLYILAWSLVTGLTGAVGSLAGMMAVRLAAGVAQAGAYPTCAAVVRRWMPLTSRGMANSVIAFGGRVGGAIAPLLTALLVISFVPLEVSPLLSARDILLPLNAADGSTEQMSARELRIVALRKALLGRTALEVIEATDRGMMAKGLNPLIEGPVLLELSELEGVALEKEARRLFAREQLTDAQRERLNRLILESVFQNSIRKLYVQGWRPVMFVYGLLGLPIALLFWWIVRDDPAAHPRTNSAEVALIGKSQSTNVERPPFPWRGILTSRTLWLLSISQFGTNIGWAFLVTWMPRFLDEVHQVPFAERGLMTSIPIFCGWPGVIFGGWLTDFMVRRFGLKWGRALPIGLTRFVAAGCYFAVLLTGDPWIAIGLFSLVAFATDSGTGAVWSVNQDVGGPYTASVLGWGNMWGNIGAAVSPVLLQSVMKVADWNTAFAVFGGSYFLAGMCGLFIDSSAAVAETTARKEHADTN